MRKWNRYIASSSWISFISQAIWNPWRKPKVLMRSAPSKSTNYTVSRDLWPLSNWAWPVVVEVLGPVRRQIAVVPQGQVVLYVDLLDDGDRRFRPIATPLTGDIDEMTTPVAPTLRIFFILGVRYGVASCPFDTNSLPQLQPSELLRRRWLRRASSFRSPSARSFNGIVSQVCDGLWTAHRQKPLWTLLTCH